MEKMKMNTADLRAILMKLCHDYNSPVLPQYWGFYKAGNGDIIVMSPFFVLRIKNLETPEIEPDTFFNLVSEKFTKGYPYPMNLNDCTKILDTDKVLSKTSINLQNMLGKFERLSPDDKVKSRVIINRTPFDEGEFPVIFSARENGIPVATAQNGARVVFSEDSYVPAEKIKIGVPYKVTKPVITNDGVKVTVLKEQGLVQVGILKSSGVWEPKPENFTTETIPMEYTENTNSVVTYAGFNMSPLHLSTNMLHDILKIFTVNETEYFDLYIPAPEVAEVKVFNTVKGGNMGPKLICDGNGKVLEDENKFTDQPIENLLAIIRSKKKFEEDVEIEVAIAGLAYSISGYQRG